MLSCLTESFKFRKKYVWYLSVGISLKIKFYELLKVPVLLKLELTYGFIKTQDVFDSFTSSKLKTWNLKIKAKKIQEGILKLL